MTAFEKAMEFIHQAKTRGSVLGLDTIKELLRRLGNPQDSLRFIHVAGTNGKGSVCAYLASVLKEAGYRTGRFLSPAVMGYRERIQVDGVWIGEEDFAEQIEKIKQAADDMVSQGFFRPTAFEIETAAGFLFFKKKKCGAVVLEVGLGGRLDATNIVRTVDCAVFTSISPDHMETLGEKLSLIAEEKAGIIKERARAVSYPQHKEVKEVLCRTAGERKADMRFLKEDAVFSCSFTLEGTEFSCRGERPDDIYVLKTKMLGENQVMNAALCVEAIRVLNEAGYSISKEAVKRGIAKATWPGRFSIVHENPCVIVDGAHNRGAAQSLARSTALYFKEKPLIRILGVFRDKEYEEIIKRTVKKEDTVFCLTPAGARGLDSAVLTACAAQYCKKAVNAGAVRKALSMALALAKPEDVILIYGSLSYLREVYTYFEN